MRRLLLVIVVLVLNTNEYVVDKNWITTTTIPKRRGKKKYVDNQIPSTVRFNHWIKRVFVVFQVFGLLVRLSWVKFLVCLECVTSRIFFFLILMTDGGLLVSHVCESFCLDGNSIKWKGWKRWITLLDGFRIQVTRSFQSVAKKKKKRHISHNWVYEEIL